MRLDKSFDDGKTKPKSSGLVCIRLVLVEYRPAPLRRNTSPVVANKTFNPAFFTSAACIDDDFPPRRVGDRIGNQVLKHPSDQTGVGIDDELFGHGVGQACGSSVCNGM